MAFLGIGFDFHNCFFFLAEIFGLEIVFFLFLNNADV